MANMRNAIWGQTSNDHKHTKIMWANSAKIALKKWISISSSYMSGLLMNQLTFIQLFCSLMDTFPIPQQCYAKKMLE